MCAGRTANQRLWRYIRPYRRPIALGMGFSLLTVGFNIAIPFVSRYVVDGLAAGALSGMALLRWLGLYVIATAFATALSYWMRWLPLKVGHQVETDIRRDLFNHLTGLEREFFREHHTGDLLNRLSSDVRAVGFGFGQGLMQNGRMIFVLILGFGVMFSLNVKLAALVLALVPAMVGSFTWFSQRIKRGHIIVQEELSEMASFNQESFAGIQTVKSFALEERWRARFAERNRALMHKNLQLVRIHELTRPLAGFWFAVSSVLVLLVGGRLVITEELTLGGLVQFTQYLLYMQWPLLSVGWVLNLIQRGRASWGRIDTLLQRAPGITEPVEVLPMGSAAPLEIRFEQVGLNVGGVTLLEDINLTIPPGVRVGITGPTGSGKTTLLSLLPRLLDVTSGAVRVGGRDVREWPLTELRGGIGMAEQEPVLFSDTLANNIRFGAPEISDEVMLKAADLAHLHADVAQLPQQYETWMGERGVTLSGGQRQRASLGRALSRDPRILILDDVLAAVDTETEAAILAKLQRVFATRTTLLASHRVRTLAAMDWIVVLENGRITQRGTHHELIQQPGYYRRLHERQQLAAAI